jgi:hypothetical protein
LSASSFRGRACRNRSAHDNAATRRNGANACPRRSHADASARLDDAGTRTGAGRATYTADAPGLGLGRFDAHSHGNGCGGNRRKE